MWKTKNPEIICKLIDFNTVFITTTNYIYNFYISDYIIDINKYGAFIFKLLL